MYFIYTILYYISYTWTDTIIQSLRSVMTWTASARYNLVCFFYIAYKSVEYIIICKI